MNTQHADTAPTQTYAATQTVKYNKGRPVKILLDATRAFCRFDRPSQSDIRQYKEFFYSLIDQTSAVERREISISLARNYYTPRTVAIFLALGDVSGSTPILLFSPVLKEVDLIAIAVKCSVPGLRVLARRDGLSLRLKKVIDERNDATASRILHLDGYTATAMAPKAEPNAVITAKVDASTPNNPQDELMALATRGGRLGKQKPDVSPDASPDSSNEFVAPFEGISNALIVVARNRDQAKFCTIVGDAASLHPKFVGELLTESNPEALCTLLKALHIPNSGASQILLLLNRKIGTSIQLFRSIMAKYDLLDEDKCRGELIRTGAHFKNESQNTPSRSIKTYSDVQSSVSRLEIALRTRQEALGQTVRKPSFGNRVRKQFSAA
ncbi:MAG: hypothetical protein JKX91_12155 [Rhizobiaceae bacterium]|nr:hypothetical protein [Rhizobiaceae bacterium]